MKVKTPAELDTDELQSFIVTELSDGMQVNMFHDRSGAIDAMCRFVPQLNGRIIARFAERKVTYESAQQAITAEFRRSKSFIEDNMNTPAAQGNRA